MQTVFASFIEDTIMLIHAVFLLGSLASIYGLPFVNLCPPIEAMKDLDINKFSGVWYERERGWYTPNITTRCHQETYSIVPGFNEIKIEAKFLTMKTNRTVFSKGTAFYSPKTTGVWNYLFPETRAAGIIKVLNTDYDNFAILYSCQSVDVYTIELAWAVTRTRQTNMDLIKIPDQEYQYLQQNLGYLVTIDQSNCGDSNDAPSTENPTTTTTTTTTSSSDTTTSQAT